MSNNCLKCGSLPNPGERFCRNCGSELTNSLTQNTNNQPNVYNPTQQGVVTPMPNNPTQQGVVTPMPNSPMQQGVVTPMPNSPMQQGVVTPMPNNNQNPQVQNNGDNILLSNYIGKNAQKIMKGGFSILAFLLGPIYLLFRKMYLYGIALWVIYAISSYFLPTYYGYVALFGSIASGLAFKNMYLKHAKEEIEKIKSINRGFSFDALVMECRRRGGTNKAVAIITGIILLIFVVLPFFGSNDRLVCKSSEGYITINYSNNTIISYISQGLRYDLDAQKEIADEIGADQYSIEFTRWFETNTDGTCVRENLSLNSNDY